MNFEKVLAVVLVGGLLSVSGCSSGSIKKTTTLPDGRTIENCSASYSSFFGSSEEKHVSGCGAEGGSTGADNDKVGALLSSALLNLAKKGAALP